MKLRNYLNEQTIEGVTKNRAKSIIYKAVEKCTKNKLYSDRYWQGPQCVWDTFDELGFAEWHITNSKYIKGKDDIKMGIEMPTSKVWHFEIKFVDNKSKVQKIGGYLTAAGAGSVKEPLEKYDLVLVLY